VVKYYYKLWKGMNILKFYLSGDLEEVKKYIDIDSIDRTDEPEEGVIEFDFFCGKVPEKDDLLIEMDADVSFDPEYDSVSEKYVFVVGADEEKLKKALKEAEDTVESAPFFPLDWKPERGKKRYVLNSMMCFENMRDCLMYMDFIMNCLNGSGFFKMDMSIVGLEFSSDSNKIRYIKNCKDNEIDNIKNLHGTIAVFDIDSKVNGLEYLSGVVNDMHTHLEKISDSKMHFLQMFYIEGDTSLMYFYWK
jgi:hypothetical protein